ncbi:hypothetical protein LJK88_12055 [Paenibacillus sp. P26]|nr:hypothetical protein LJK88_12055 [Paenibacillus sp. P26]
MLSEAGEGDRTYEEQVRLIDRERFTDMLLRSGLMIDEVYGGYDASGYEPAVSKRMIFVGRRGK